MPYFAFEDTLGGSDMEAAVFAAKGRRGSLHAVGNDGRSGLPLRPLERVLLFSEESAERQRVSKRERDAVLGVKTPAALPA